MKRDVFRWHPVDFSLGNSDALKDRERFLFYEIRQRTSSNQFANLSMIAAMNVPVFFMGMLVRMFMAVLTFRPVNVRFFVSVKSRIGAVGLGGVSALVFRIM